jgi:hypothetical protein
VRTIRQRSRQRAPQYRRVTPILWSPCTARLSFTARALVLKSLPTLRTKHVVHEIVCCPGSRLPQVNVGPCDRTDIIPKIARGARGAKQLHPPPWAPYRRNNNTTQSEKCAQCSVGAQVVYIDSRESSAACTSLLGTATALPNSAHHVKSTPIPVAVSLL